MSGGVYRHEDGLVAMREELLKNGYKPLPAKDKRVMIRGWTTADITSSWVRAHIGFPNTGLRCDGLCAVDLDCDTPGIAAMVRKIAIEMLGDTPCIRVRGPRLIMLYRGDNNAETRATKKYLDKAGKGNRVECLRGNKRQFIAFGTHPSGDPYTWPDESPRTVPFDQLPIVSDEALKTFIAEVDAEFQAQEDLTLHEEESNSGGYKIEEILKPDTRFTIVGPPGYESYLTCKDIIEVLEHMGADAALQCNLDGIRPSSDSRAGVARLANGALIITDFVKERIYKLPTDLSLSLPAELLVQDEEDVFPAAVGPILGRRFFCEATGEGHDPDRPEVGYALAATRVAFGKTAVEAWIASCRRVVDMAFEPGADTFIKTDTGTYYNLYREPDHPSTGGELATWREFMEHLLPVPEERAWFEEWLAYKAQHPEQKCHGVIMVAQNVFGAGRGTLFEVLRRAFGEHNTRTVDFSTVVGKSGQAQFNDWMSRTLFVFVPEVKETDPHAAKSFSVKEQAYEALKEVADPTASKLRIKEKYGAIREEAIYANMLAATNHYDAIAIPEGDRRFAVLSNGGAMSVDLAKRVHAWLRKPENIGALWRHLRTVDVKYVPSGVPLSTAAKRQMVSASVSDVDHLMAIIRRRCAGAWATFPRLQELLREAAEDEGMALSPGAASYAYRIMRSEFPRRDARIKLHDSRVYAHRVRGPEALDAAAIRDEMLLSEGSLLEDEDG